MTKQKISEKGYFAITPNEILNDDTLSFRAKGLFSYIQSKPDNWLFSVWRIMSQTKDGEKAIRSAIKELENAGLLRRIPRRKENGDFGGYYFKLSATKQSINVLTAAEKAVAPKAVAPKAVAPKAVAPNGIAFSNIEDSNKENSNIEKKNLAAIAAEPDFSWLNSPKLKTQ